jgi:hypothetical protein
MYRKVNISTVIKLLLRSKKLYQAMGEVKKILQNILTQDEAYFAKDGPVETVLSRYERQPGLVLKEEDDRAVQKCQQGILRLSRRISVFQRDHRIFKHFKFKGKYHQKTLFKRAKKLCRFLVTMESAEEAFKYPTLDIDGQLQFVALAPGEDPTRYHTAEPEEAQEVDEPCVRSFKKAGPVADASPSRVSRVSKKISRISKESKESKSVSKVSKESREDPGKLPLKRIVKKKQSTTSKDKGSTRKKKEGSKSSRKV